MYSETVAQNKLLLTTVITDGKCQIIQLKI